MRARRALLVLLAGLAALHPAASARLAKRADAAVYWSGRSLVWAANTDGSMVVGGYPFGIANLIPRTSSCGVAVNGTHLYWGDQSNGTIGRMELSKASSGKADLRSERVVIDPGPGQRRREPRVALPSTPGACYWGSFEGEIGRANLDGSSPERSSSPVPGSACGVAVDQGATSTGATPSWKRSAAPVSTAARWNPNSSPRHPTRAASPSTRRTSTGAEANRRRSGTPTSTAAIPNPASSPSPGLLRRRRKRLPRLLEHGPRYSRRPRRARQPRRQRRPHPRPRRHYGAGCGIALDSRVFQPPWPPASEPLRFGKPQPGARASC